MGVRIRILVVIGTLEVGGTETQLLEILPRLVAAGEEVHIHTLTARGALADRFEAVGIPVLGPDGDGKDRLPGRTLAVLGAWPSLWRQRREWNPDIVHFFLPEAYLLGSPPFLFDGRIRRIMSRRSLNAYQKKRPLLAWMEHLMHRTMHALVANSRVIARELVGEGADPTRVRTIHNGIDAARFDVAQIARARMRLALGLRPAQVAVLCVANLIPYKGHADLIEAMARLRESSVDWVLLCAGRDGGLGESLRRRAEGAGVGSRVRLLGERDDVPELLAAADIAVLASHEEGLPNAIAEAMAAGLAIVATNVGGVGELIGNGESGLLAEPHDHVGLARQIERLLDDPALRARLAAVAHARVRSEFGVDAAVAAHRRLYAELTASAAAIP